MTDPTSCDTVVVILEREWIEARDIGRALEVLNALIRDRSTVEFFAGRINLCFEGWDEDPRELPEIAVIRQWFRMLTAAFPYWSIFCDRTTSTLPLVMNLLLDETKPVNDLHGTCGFSHSKDAIATAIQILFDAQNRLCQKLNISWEVNAKWVGEVSECLVAYSIDL
jgi:hypothetical protein